MRPTQKMRASDWIESEVDREPGRHGTNSSVRRLPFVRHDLQDRNVRERRLHPTAFLIGHKSSALSRILIISHIFHSQPASRTRLADRDRRFKNDSESPRANQLFLNQGAGQPGSLCQPRLVAVTGHEAGVSRDDRERYVQGVK